MKPLITSCLLPIVGLLIFTSCSSNPTLPGEYTRHVNKFIGTTAAGCVSPVASVPHGMIQLAPDTRYGGSGYDYRDTTLLGFSHVHKSGGGCGDFLDILFLPLQADYPIDTLATLRAGQFRSPFSHSEESSSPGYYSVALWNGAVKAELTASDRSSVQRYVYSTNGSRPFLVDLQHGSRGACTIEPGMNFDTVFSSRIEQVDEYTIRGYRLTHGWAPEQHVYFYARFSEPIKAIHLYVNDYRAEGITSVEGINLKAILQFADNAAPLEVKSAISSVSMEGAEKNFNAEVENRSFEEIRAEADKRWNKVLKRIRIQTSDPKFKEIFYTSMYNVFLYPMLYSDVDFNYRGPDRQVHNTGGFPYYGGVVGLWDTFRAACPLIAAIARDVMSDYVNTFLAHFDVYGQLPIWTLAGVENFQMIGLHSMPVITNAYLNGVKFDSRRALDAMVASAMKDSCGTSMGYFVGLRNYKRYGYVPFDLEMESVARTLEYAYDDYCIARLAEQMEEHEISSHFAERALNYRNVYDPSSGYMRGKDSKGNWRTPFDPLMSNHRRDDYCEGNAWQWTFFVPHDVEGLASLMGGDDALALRLDSLFTNPHAITGDNVSHDISGLIGQYAHGNEPSHHTAYMYNRVGQPRKTQQYVRQILTTLYDNTPDGICGNDDTGQMSAWFVFSAMGFYPLDPASGRYELGAPLLDQADIELPNGRTFRMVAENLSSDTPYVESVYLNGNKLDRSYITFEEFHQGGELKFIMGK